MLSTDSFAKYFLICGLESSSGKKLLNHTLFGQFYHNFFNPGLETDESVAEYCGRESYGRSAEANPLEKSYKPKILRHYPDITSW